LQKQTTIKRWLRPAFAESYRLLRMNQGKKLVAVPLFVFEMHLIRGVTEGPGVLTPPWQAM